MESNKKMRVISGLLKGKSINFLKNTNTRPLKDSVKENIFNIIKHSHLINIKLENSNVLDLYSGVGSFGIECISRGAKKVTFVEKDLNASEILNKNLSKLSISSKTVVHTSSIENMLLNIENEKFDIFFFDPPFKDLKFINNLKLIKKKGIFEKKHILIIHREKKSNDNFGNCVKIIETKNYGRSKIIFCVIA